MNRVITYGIFRKRKWGPLDKIGDHIATTRLQGLKMYTYGAFPYVIPDDTDYGDYRPIRQVEGSGNRVVVDVWEVSDDMLMYMDSVEGTPIHYTREIVFDVGFIYIPNRKDWDSVRKLEQVKDGDFLKHKGKA